MQNKRAMFSGCGGYSSFALELSSFNLWGWDDRFYILEKLPTLTFKTPPLCSIFAVVNTAFLNNLDTQIAFKQLGLLDRDIIYTKMVRGMIVVDFGNILITMILNIWPFLMKMNNINGLKFIWSKFDLNYSVYFC